MKYFALIFSIFAFFVSLWVARYVTNILHNPRITDGLGADNVVIGNMAGHDLTSGSRNILVGANTKTSSPTANDELNIGNLVYGDLAGKLVTVDGDIVVNGRIIEHGKE